MAVPQKLGAYPADKIDRTQLRAGERIAVAVSGGADSVALLLLLIELREALGFVPLVIHLNHKLRGKSSEADEKFVAKLAAKYGLEFIVARESIAARAKREKSNLEDTARRARYAFFERLVKEGRATKVAVAHSADDQAETVLAHILRGTGLSGLGGIHPQSGVVFRPLLAIRRAELRKYLRGKKQAWREDASNRDTTRMRSRIRYKLLPLLEKKFQTATVEHLCQLTNLARRDESLLDALASEWLEKSAHRPPGGAPCLPINKLKECPISLATRAIRKLIESEKPRPGQISATHIQAVMKLAEHTGSGKALQLPGGLEVRRDPNYLRFHKLPAIGKRGARSAPAKDYCHKLDLSQSVVELPFQELSCALRFRVIDWPCKGRETKVIGAVLDRDRLQQPLLVRNWKAGDAFQPIGHQNRHKVARLLNELGVSRWEKRNWPVLTSDGVLAWVQGLPPAREFAVASETQTALLIDVDRNS
jgi:tRNA(Ile)-lysidine synthase